MKFLPVHCYLKMLRHVKGYGQRVVASWIGVSIGAYSHLENRRYKSLNPDYLDVIARNYDINPQILNALSKVDIEAFGHRKPLDPAERLADFLLHYTDPEKYAKYGKLSYEEKWCLYYFNLCSDKQALLSAMSAAPAVLPFMFN